MDIKIELHDIAYQAYYNTSFSPEKRRDQILSELSEELTADLHELGDAAGNYENKYINHARNWLQKKSRCISVMITGPANFPVRRNEKANNAEDKAWQDFRKWRTRYSKAVNRIHNLSPEDDMDVSVKRLDKLLINQMMMKGSNKILRGKSDNKLSELIELGFDEEKAKILLLEDHRGFPSYSLTNNNARIKAARNKIITMRKRIEVKADFKPIEFPGGVIDIQADRVIICHNEKLDRDVINKIKARGFHWSRQYSCWSRKHTAAALCDAREVVGI